MAKSVNASHSKCDDYYLKGSSPFLPNPWKRKRREGQLRKSGYTKAYERVKNKKYQSILFCLVLALQIFYFLSILDYKKGFVKRKTIIRDCGTYFDKRLNLFL